MTDFNSNQHLQNERENNSHEGIIDRDILHGPSRGLHHRSAPAVMMLSGTAAWGGARVEALREPRGSCQQIPSTETHLLRMSILPLNPSKGFPESSSMSTGPHVFEVMILCVFMALKLLSYGCIVSSVWSRSLFEVLQGTLNVTFGYRPNILDLY